MTTSDATLEEPGARERAPGVRGRLVHACAAAFTASFCTMVIELVAARVMAPYVGVSLYTWTSIIGVILAGISLGAWAGGALADRAPRPSTLGWLLFASGLSALATAPIADGIGAAILAERLADSLVTRVLILSAAAFFLPSFLLGMISPVTVKLALRDLDRTGGIVGKIYAFSTLGAILGTFATGFVLIAWLGTRAILLAIAALLIVSSIVFGRRGARALVALALIGTAAAGFSRVPAAAALASRLHPVSRGDYYVHESEYYTIRLQQSLAVDGSWIEVLILDHLVHSFTNLRDPSYLHYGYLKVFDEILRWKESEVASPRALFLGGGGYTLPRWVSASRPGVGVDVVEIDPEVTRTAVEWLGVADDGPIRTVNDDARWFVMNATGSWDVVFGDAFNDLSIPFHLTTLEFDRELRRIAGREGVLAANVIDNYARGKFLPSYLATMRRAFGEENVALVAEPFAFELDAQATMVVVASPSREALARLLLHLDGVSASARLPLRTRRPAEIDTYLAHRRPVLLTDDFAPVDNLLAPLFAERYRYRAP